MTLIILAVVTLIIIATLVSTMGVNLHLDREGAPSRLILCWGQRAGSRSFVRISFTLGEATHRGQGTRFPITGIAQVRVDLLGINYVPGRRSRRRRRQRARRRARQRQS